MQVIFYPLFILKAEGDEITAPDRFHASIIK
jgi:hypothetical protein